MQPKTKTTTAERAPPCAVLDAYGSRAPRELLLAAMAAYRAAGNVEIAEVLEALADADEAESWKKKNGPLAWARGQRRRTADRGVGSMVAMPSRADAVARLVSICATYVGKAARVDARTRGSSPHVETDADSIAQRVALMPLPVLLALGAPSISPTMTAAEAETFYSPPAVHSRRKTIRRSLDGMWERSRLDVELLAENVLVALGMTKGRARGAIRGPKRKT